MRPRSSAAGMKTQTQSAGTIIDIRPRALVSHWVPEEGTKDQKYKGQGYTACEGWWVPLRRPRGTAW